MGNKIKSKKRTIHIFTALFAFIFGFFLISPTITGNAIGGLSVTGTSILGILFIIGGFTELVILARNKF